MKAAIHTFARYVPRELVRDLMESGQPLTVGGQTRHLTVMFTDVRSFTGIAERMPAHDLMLHISEHFDVATRLIMETGGTVDKFIGDSVMAFWGAPNLVDEQGVRACRAALAIRARMEQLNAGWLEEGKPTLFIRFGIHADTVVVGNIGSAERLSYTALGDGVVVAQRLEGINKNYGTQICVSQTIYREVGDRFVLRPLDFVAVKGRRAALLIYELLGTKGDAADPLAATAEQIEIARATQRAFDAYLEQNWQDALEAYAALAGREPDDPLYPLFVERCRHYLSHPPGSEWSSVFSRGDN
jgi:adenylate cyclase